MKKTTKIVSALLILALMLAQVVCVNAAVTANFSISAEQTDHYEKTIMVKVTNGSKVTYVRFDKYDKDNKLVAQEGQAMSNTSTFSVSTKVRPTEIAKVKVVILEGNEESSREYTVGGNSYYNINSGSSSSNSGTWDGIKSGSSSNGTYTYSYSNGSNVWEYYNPNAWTGYYGDDSNTSDSTTYYVTCRTLNVRRGAGTGYSKVGTLSRNTAVEVYDIENGWAVIMYKGNLRYVSAKYLSR